jgi:uncharacterized ferredoxin-like protein
MALRKVYQEESKMKYESFDLEKRAAFAIADLMVLASKTAPKACGLDNVETLVLDGKEKDALSSEMRKIAKDTGADFFERDAGNVDNSHLVVLIGVKDSPVGLTNCGFCGFEDCVQMKKAGGKCTLNITDLGIAAGSAVSVAANHRADNRIMFSAGKAALNLKFFHDDVKTCYGIPLSSSSKSIFFDRGIVSVLAKQE